MSTHRAPPKNPPNQRLRNLIAQTGLTQIDALALFNRGLVKPYSVSAWKAFLSDPQAARWRRFDDRLLQHAEKVFARIHKKA